MPGNRLSLAVRVGCQEDLFRLFGQDFQFLDHRSFFIGYAVLGIEIIVHVNRKLGTQQVTHMTHRCPHRVPLAEEAAHSLGLGR